MARQRWDSFDQAIVAADGTATAVVSASIRPPLRYVEIDNVSISTNLGRSDGAKAYLYRDTESPVSFLASSDRGGGDSTSGNYILSAGASLVCKWTGGTPGTTATLRVEGWLTETVG